MLKQPFLASRAFSYFWLFLKLSVLFAIVLGISKIPGDFSLSAFGVNIQTSLSFAVAVLFLILALLWFVFGVLRTILSFGSFIKYKRDNKLRNLSDVEFQRGLCAFFADELNDAFTFFSRSAKYHADKRHLATAFMALSSLNSDQRDQAASLFQKLTESTDLKFIGFFGLYHLEKGDKVTLLERAYKELPTNKWILMELFKAYQNHLTQEAISKSEGLVGRLYDMRHINRGERAALYAAVNVMRSKLSLKEGDTAKAIVYAERAYDFDPNHIDAVVQLAELTSKEKALKILSKAFKANHEAKLAEAIQRILPASVETFHTFEEKLEDNRDPKVLFLLAALAYQAKLWGIAKQLLREIPESLRDSRYNVLQQQVDMGEKANVRKAG